MKTVKENEALSAEVKLALLKEAKGGTWYDGWRPFCVQTVVPCSSPRMISMPYGFRCPDCGNMIGWNCERLAESPLNLITKDPETEQDDLVAYYAAKIRPYIESRKKPFTL